MRVLNCFLLVIFSSVVLCASEQSKQSCQIQVSLGGQEKIPKHVSLYLFKDGQTVQKLKVGESGTVNVTDLSPGDYQMLVSSKEMTIAASRALHIDSSEHCHENLLAREGYANPAKHNAPEPVNSAELLIPSAGRVAFHSAMLLMQDGKFEQAKEEFLAFSKEYPGISQSYNNLGVIANQEGDFKEAQNYFERSLEINSHNPAALINLSEEFCRQGNFAAALPLMDRYLQVAPRNPQVYLIRAWAHHHLGRLDAVIADVKELHRSAHKGLDEAHLLSAAAYEKQGKWNEAVREYQFYVNESSDESGRTKVIARINTLTNPGQAQSRGTAEDLTRSNQAGFAMFGASNNPH